MQALLIIGFNNLTEAGFLVRSQTIGTCLTNNTYFPMPWPIQVLAPPAIVTEVAKYQVLYNDAKDGDRAKIKARHTARVTLTTDFQNVAHYLQIVANGKVGLLATTGYELRHDMVKTTSLEPLGALLHLKVTRTALPGGLIVHARALTFADVYNLQIAFADPSVEANWIDAGSYSHCNRIELTGLAAGKTYYVRIRGFNKNGHGVWTTSAGVLVL